MTDQKINFPVGNADIKALPYLATQAVTIDNEMTILDFAILTGNTTLNLTVNPLIRNGAKLFIKVPATANANDLLLGAGIDGPNIVGVATKTKTQSFTLVNGVFLPDGASVQIN